MLAWTQQNTMQRAMWTVLELPQSHAISKTINMLTNKSEPQQKCRLGTVSKISPGAQTGPTGAQPRPQPPSRPKTHSRPARAEALQPTNGPPRETNKSQANTTTKQRRGLDRNVPRPTPGDPLRHYCLLYNFLPKNKGSCMGAHALLGLFVRRVEEKQ